MRAVRRDLAHRRCVECHEGTKSLYGVCEPCPIGATPNEAKTECVDVDECQENDGGCDLLALYGDDRSPCTNEAFEGAGYRCGKCPPGFDSVPIVADYTVTRTSTHGTVETLTFSKRINGSRCNLPPPPPPPPNTVVDVRRERNAVLPTVEVELNTTQNFTESCNNERAIKLIHTHIATSIGVQPADLDRLQCCRNGCSTPMESVQTICSHRACKNSSWLSFTLRSIDYGDDIKEFLRQMRTPTSPLHARGYFILDNPTANSTTNRRTIPVFQCPAGSTLADSQTYCVRCVEGKYNPSPGGICKFCPDKQTSTKPFHSCHCKPMFYNTSRVNIRCFDPYLLYGQSIDDKYKKSYAITARSPEACFGGETCYFEVDVFRGEGCCKPCGPCVDCTSVGNSTDEYDEPPVKYGTA